MCIGNSLIAYMRANANIMSNSLTATDQLRRESYAVESRAADLLQAPLHSRILTPYVQSSLFQGLFPLISAGSLPLHSRARI